MTRSTIPNLFFVFSLLLLLVSCQKEDTPGQTAKNNELVVGYWLLKKGTSYAVNDKGITIITANMNPDVFAHQLLSDGKYIGHDLVSNKTEEGTWKLDVINKDLNDIEEGTLSIYTPSSMSASGNPFADPDGSFKYQIATVQSKINNKKSAMYLKTKKYESYPYKENWVEFILEKQ